MLVVNKKNLQFAKLDEKTFSDIGVNVIKLKHDVKEVDLVNMISSISKAEVKRKIKQGSVWIGNQKSVDPDEIFPCSGNVAVTVFIGKELQGVVFPKH